jgi:arylsulfatase A-like enzyme
VLFASAWDAAVNARGVPGMALGGGAGGHGGASVYEMAATLIAAGPGFRRGAVSRVPTGHADLLPTILHLLGQPPAPGRDGRVLLEGLADGVSEGEVEVRQEEMTAEQGACRAVLRRSHAGGSVYVDQANVGTISHLKGWT